jgi:hypothetical protein
LQSKQYSGASLADRDLTDFALYLLINREDDLLEQKDLQYVLKSLWLMASLIDRGNCWTTLGREAFDESDWILKREVLSCKGDVDGRTQT